MIDRKRLLAFIMAGLVVLMISVSNADNGRYYESPHGSSATGVWRVQDCPRGSCAQCHVTHDAEASLPFGLFQANSNRLCFAASLGGCHADRPSGGTSGYPAQESDRLPVGSSDPGYFEHNSGGIRVAGVQHRVRWPGQFIWEDPQYSPHFASPDMPLKDMDGNGSCDNCHNVHGGPGEHDLLDTTYRGIVGSQSGSQPANYTLCLSCHSQFGPATMDDTARTIAYYYDRSMNPGTNAGHGISNGGGYVPSMSRLPCYDCHNPHGSAGNNGTAGNRYLLSDQRPGWSGLTDIKNNAEQVRRFCFGCHRSSDGFDGGTVEGMTLNALPSDESAHQYSSTQHCYDCHGGDYSSPTSHNVHNPDPGD
ncbi:MAG: hypothetical protein NTW07_13235 [candidate division Zixibacteria bacterium]|nr:hypothetical protein [candidate division Zixibacteria bacterium]